MARTIRKSADGLLVRDGNSIRTTRRPNTTPRRLGTRTAVVLAAIREA